jgi:hypothetical protein
MVLWACGTGARGLTDPAARRAAGVLLGLFGLAVIVTWSPVDFWSWLPRAAHVVQFSYRFLSQVAWIGALLFAYAAVIAGRGSRSAPRDIAACILVLLVAHGSFLPPATDAKVDLNHLVLSPDMGWGQDDYLFNPKLVPPDEPGQAQLVTPVEKMPPQCARVADTVTCHLAVTDRPTRAQLPVLFYPKLLDLTVNGQPASYFPMSYHTVVLTGVQLDPGAYDLTARFRGLPSANLVSALAWFATVSALVVFLARDARSKVASVSGFG